MSKLRAVLTPAGIFQKSGPTGLPRAKGREEALPSFQRNKVRMEPKMEKF